MVPLQFFSYSYVNLSLELCSSICTCIYSVIECSWNSIQYETQFSVFSGRYCISLPLFQLVWSSFEVECSQGGDNVTPCNENRSKISFPEKSAGDTNGGIDRLYCDPRSVLHNHRWNHTLPKNFSLGKLVKSWIMDGLIVRRSNDGP